MNLQEFARARREHLDMRLEDVVIRAAKHGHVLNRGRISQVENGTTGVTQLPTALLLQRLAAGLGVPKMTLVMAALVGMGVANRGGPYDRFVDSWVTRAPITPQEDVEELDVRLAAPQPATVARPVLPRQQPHAIEFLMVAAE